MLNEVDAANKDYVHMENINYADYDEKVKMHTPTKAIIFGKVVEFTNNTATLFVASGDFKLKFQVNKGHILSWEYETDHIGGLADELSGIANTTSTLGGLISFAGGFPWVQQLR